jgi:uncharacterized protein YjbJ (UPF0337 family)
VAPYGCAAAKTPNFTGCYCCDRSDDIEEGIVSQGSKDQVKGKIEEVKGKIKEKVGRATNNPRLQDEGTDQKVAGKVQKKVGQVEKVFED